MLTKTQFAKAVLQNLASVKGHDALRFEEAFTEEDAKDGGIALCMKQVGLLNGKEIDPRADSAVFLCAEELPGGDDVSVLQLTIGEIMDLLSDEATAG